MQCSADLVQSGIVSTDEFSTRLTIVRGDEGENIRGGVEESDILRPLCYAGRHVDAKWANLIPVRVCWWYVLLLYTNLMISPGMERS